MSITCNLVGKKTTSNVDLGNRSKVGGGVSSSSSSKKKKKKDQKITDWNEELGLDFSKDPSFVGPSCDELGDYHQDICKVHGKLARYSRDKNERRPRMDADLDSDRYYRRYITLDHDQEDGTYTEFKGGVSFNQVITNFKAQKLQLSHLLGDKLIRYNDAEDKIETFDTNDLMGKKYVILFIPDDPDSPDDLEYPIKVSHLDLHMAYHLLKQQKNTSETEIVFVPSDIFTTKPMFNAWFSKMPWLSVPFDKDDVRDSLLGMFGKRWIILSPDGEVLQIEGEYIFHYFGAEAYPFTDDRIQEIKTQDDRLLDPSSFSLKALLGSPDRDYLLSPLRGDDGTYTRVPITNLEQRTIGVLFLDMCPTCLTNSYTRRLEEVYKQLKERTDSDTIHFEIVFVHLPFECRCHNTGQELFDSTFGRMPWFALPYNDPTCRKLWRICHLLDKDDNESEYVTFHRNLVIVGPHGKFLERDLGGWNMFYYGPDGYPFTQNRAAEMEKLKLEALTLDSYFSTQAAGCVLLRNNRGDEVLISELSGKNVLVIFAAYYCFKYSELLLKLRRLYSQSRGTADEFEVIHISLDCSKSSYDKCAAKMPWWMYPFNKPAFYRLAEVIFGDVYNDLPGLAAFGGDRKLLTKQRFLMDSEKMSMGVFPFFNGDNLREQIIEDFPRLRNNICYTIMGCSWS